MNVKHVLQYGNMLISMNAKHVLQYGNMLRTAKEEQQRFVNTAVGQTRHHVDQFTMTAIHHDLQWPIKENLYQTRQHRTFNAHGAKRKVIIPVA